MEGLGFYPDTFSQDDGRVHINEIVQWWNDHRNALFTQNLRLFYPSSDVNDALSRTLQSNSDFFWYFNNGITLIIC